MLREPLTRRIVSSVLTKAEAATLAAVSPRRHNGCTHALALQMEANARRELQDFADEQNTRMERLLRVRTNALLKKAKRLTHTTKMLQSIICIHSLCLQPRPTERQMEVMCARA